MKKKKNKNKNKKQKESPPVNKLSIDTVEAREFVLLDKLGQRRALFSCSVLENGGFTCFQIFDDRGFPRISIQVEPNGNPFIMLNSSNESQGVAIGVNEGRGNGISIHGESGWITLSIGYRESEDPRGPNPEMTVIDKEAGRGWTLSGGWYKLQPSPE